MENYSSGSEPEAKSESMTVHVNGRDGNEVKWPLQFIKYTDTAPSLPYSCNIQFSLETWAQSVPNTEKRDSVQAPMTKLEESADVSTANDANLDGSKPISLHDDGNKLSLADAKNSLNLESLLYGLEGMLENKSYSSSFRRSFVEESQSREFKANDGNVDTQKETVDKQKEKASESDAASEHSEKQTIFKKRKKYRRQQKKQQSSDDSVGESEDGGSSSDDSEMHKKSRKSSSATKQSQSKKKSKDKTKKKRKDMPDESVDGSDSSSNGVREDEEHHSVSAASSCSETEDEKSSSRKRPKTGKLKKQMNKSKKKKKHSSKESKSAVKSKQGKKSKVDDEGLNVLKEDQLSTSPSDAADSADSPKPKKRRSAHSESRTTKKKKQTKKDSKSSKKRIMEDSDDNDEPVAKRRKRNSGGSEESVKEQKRRSKKKKSRKVSKYGSESGDEESAKSSKKISVDEKLLKSKKPHKKRKKSESKSKSKKRSSSEESSLSNLKGKSKSGKKEDDEKMKDESKVKKEDDGNKDESKVKKEDEENKKNESTVKIKAGEAMQFRKHVISIDDSGQMGVIESFTDACIKEAKIANMQLSADQAALEAEISKAQQMTTTAQMDGQKDVAGGKWTTVDIKQDVKSDMWSGWSEKAVPQSVPNGEQVIEDMDIADSDDDQKTKSPEDVDDYKEQSPPIMFFDQPTDANEDALDETKLTAKQLLEKVKQKRMQKEDGASSPLGLKLKNPPSGYFGPKLPPELEKKTVLPLIGKLPMIKKGQKSEDADGESKFNLDDIEKGLLRTSKKKITDKFAEVGLDSMDVLAATPDYGAVTQEKKLASQIVSIRSLLLVDTNRGASGTTYVS